MWRCQAASVGQSDDGPGSIRSLAVKDMTNAGPRPETSVAAVDLEVEFYEDGGHKPVETFLAGLDSTKRLAVIAAIEQVLAKQGIGELVAIQKTFEV